MIIQVFSAFWAVAMFSILTETPKKFLPYAAFSGGFAWWAYLVINNLTHSTLQAAFFSILAGSIFEPYSCQDHESTGDGIPHRRNPSVCARSRNLPDSILPDPGRSGTFNPLLDLDASHGRRDRPGDLYHRFCCQPCASLS